MDIEKEFKQFLNDGRWEKCLPMLELLNGGTHESFLDRLIYRIVDYGHCTGSVRDDKYFGLLNRAIELKITSDHGLCRALECSDIIVADILHNAGYIVQPDASIIYSVDSMLWAKRHNYKMCEGAMRDIFSIWNGSSVIDRVAMLFRDFNYSSMITEKEFTDCRMDSTILTAIFPYIKSVISDNIIIRNAIKSCAIPVITFYRVNGYLTDNDYQEVRNYLTDNDYHKMLKYASTYDEIKIICSFSGKLMRDVFVSVLLTCNDDGTLTDLIKKYFAPCNRDEIAHLQKLATDNNCFEALVEKGYLSSASSLGKKIHNYAKIDWGKLFDKERSIFFSNGWFGVEDCIEFSDKIVEKYEKLLPIPKSKISHYKKLRKAAKIMEDDRSIINFLESLAPVPWAL